MNKTEITFELYGTQFGDHSCKGIDVGNKCSGQIIGRNSGLYAQKNGEKNKAIKKVCLDRYVFAGKIRAIKTVCWCQTSRLTQMIVDCGIPIRLDIYVYGEQADFGEKYYNENDEIYVFGETKDGDLPGYKPLYYKEGDFIVGVVELECAISYDYPAYIWQGVEGNITKIEVLNTSAENLGKITNTEGLKSTDYETANKVFITMDIKKSFPCMVSNSASGYDAVKKI